jgi:hypothetical protein
VFGYAIGHFGAKGVDGNLLVGSLRPVLHGIAAANPETAAAIRGGLSPRGLHMYDTTARYLRMQWVADRFNGSSTTPNAMRSGMDRPGNGARKITPPVRCELAPVDNGRWRLPTTPPLGDSRWAAGATDADRVLAGEPSSARTSGASV